MWLSLALALLVALPAFAGDGLPGPDIPSHRQVLPPAGVYPQAVQIGAHEVELVRAEAALAKNDVRHRFNVRYAIWRATWSGGTAPYTTPEFDAMMRIGPAQIPLLVERLLDEQEAPALALYDHIVPLEFFVASADDELGPDRPGARLRAIRSVRRWLKLWPMKSYDRKD